MPRRSIRNILGKKRAERERKLADSFRIMENRAKKDPKIQENYVRILEQFKKTEAGRRFLRKVLMSEEFSEKVKARAFEILTSSELLSNPYDVAKTIIADPRLPKEEKKLMLLFIKEIAVYTGKIKHVHRIQRLEKKILK